VTDPLPRPELATGSIDVAGQPVTFRSLSRTEALQLHTFAADPDGAEDFLIATACGLSIEYVHEWRAAVDWDVVGPLVDAIIELSGLTDMPVAAGGAAGPKA